jgi:hypothetical protein
MRIAMPARWARRLLPSAGGLDPSEAPTPQEAHNGRLMMWEGPFAGLALIGVPSFYAFFAIQQGAGNTTVGWLTAGPALVSLLWLIPCSQLIQRSRSLKSPILWGLAFHRVLLMALALLTFVPAGWRSTGMVVLASAIAVPLQTWALAFDTLAGDVLTPRHFARLIGRRWAAIDLSGLIAVLLLGKMIDALPFPLNWALLTGGLGLVTLASVAIMARVQAAERARPAADDGSAERPRVTARTLWRDYRAFILLEIGVFLIYLALFAAAPLLRIYWVRELGATGGWMGGLTAAFSGGAVAGSLFWGPLSHPQRDRRVCLIGGLGCLVGYPAATALLGSLPAAAVAAAAGGFFIVANDLMIYKRVMAASPSAQRASLLAIHNIVFNGVAFLAPLLSTALADQAGARLALFVAGACGLAGALYFYALGWRPAQTPDEASGRKDALPCAS